MNLQYPLNDGYFSFKNIEIIKCKEHKFIIIGWNSAETQYCGIVIPKIRVNEELKPLKKLLQEFGPFKTMEQLKKDIQFKLGSYHEKQIIFAHGIIGFHRFLQGYYLTYIKENEAIAKIGRHKIYQIKATETLQLFELRSDEGQSNEKKYRETLMEFKAENYYYSCTYDLTNTLAKNMIINSMPLFKVQTKKQQESQSCFSSDKEYLGICELFQYNYGLIKQFVEALKCKKWILSITHGFAKHINLKLKGTIFNLVVIARRSRHHAGTRYIKRGINGQGFTANFVQVQQIVINYNSSQDTRPVCSSFVQVRGSVPVFWMQKPSVVIPKPAIEIRRNVDSMCVATRKHFHDLICRYGRIIFCINLMKQKERTPRQSELSKEYQSAINLINKNDLKEENAIHYSEIDMKFQLKRDKKAFVQQIKSLAYFAVERTGIFLCINPSTSSHQQLLEFQNGIIRVNCVDCLDRTNSFQQLVGETVLAIQLNRLIGQKVTISELQLDQNITSVYSKLYEEMGDLISIQYGSSLAHKQKIQKSTQSRFQFLTSIKRHWNNVFRDEDRQIQLDIFLGYQPQKDEPSIWDVKAIIEHYPDEFTSTFQNMKKSEWFNKAYKIFRGFYHLQDFERLSETNIFEINNYMLEKISKDQLIHKFRAEIVSSLINEKQEPSVNIFVVEPQIQIKQRVWKEMNPRSATIRTLQDELNLKYNKMDFLINQGQTEEGPRPPIKEVNMYTRDFRKQKLSRVNLNEEIDFMKNVQNIVSKQIYNDDEIQELIEKICRGQIVDDEEIDNNVNDLYSLVTEDLLSDDFMEKNIISDGELYQEIKKLEANLANHNFIGNGEEIKKDVIYRKERKPDIVSPHDISPKKREMVKDNKVKMLEKIMQKSFSHGQKCKIDEI